MKLLLRIFLLCCALNRYALPDVQAPKLNASQTQAPCDGPAYEPLKPDAISSMLASRNFESKDILDLVRERGHERLSSDELRQLVNDHASADLVKELSGGPDIYIGWSVLPSNTVRDNYGRYVMNKYFALDVAVANRSATDTVVITALEFCHGDTDRAHRDVSVDPTLVRGSLQKGELAGRRSKISLSIQAAGSIMSPAAPFFKNALNRGTFSTAAALFSPLKSGFDLVEPDTIATYLTNWDKDQVFKNGFTVAPGGSQRGRIFIAIEYVYPQASGATASTARADYRTKWKNATAGKFNPEEVKDDIRSLVLLGQQITIGNRRRFVSNTSGNQ